MNKEARMTKATMMIRMTEIKKRLLNPRTRTQATNDDDKQRQRMTKVTMMIRMTEIKKRLLESDDDEDDNDWDEDVEDPKEAAAVRCGR
jgi:hypothetical protein